jgi:predicted metal-binding membrane protein
VPPEGSAARPKGRSPLERLISREQAVVGLCLAVLIALAWFWLASAPPGGHGMEGGHSGMAMPAAPPDPWSAGYLLPAFAMWTLMMVAMMLPSAAPMILLYSRVAARSDRGPPLAPLVLCAYLALWTGFAAFAALAQALLIATGLVGEMSLAIGDRRVAGALLLLAGLYQLTPLKRACLEQCRSPLSFILRLSRPGAAGALRLGAAHGLYCLGCCWALMLLLFVGGVMNLAWIAGLALLVVVEKFAPARLWISRLIATVLVVAGATLMAIPGLGR